MERSSATEISTTEIFSTDMEAHLAIYHIYYLLAKQIPEPTVKNIKTQSIPYFNYMAVIGPHLADNRTYPSCLPINSTN